MNMLKLLLIVGLSSAASQLFPKIDEGSARTDLRQRELQNNFQGNCQKLVNEARRGLPAGTTCNCVVETGFQGYKCESPRNCLSGVDYEDSYGEMCPGTICETYNNKVELRNDGTVVSTEDTLLYGGQTDYREVTSLTTGSKVVTKVQLNGQFYECLSFELCEDGPFSFDCSNIQQGAVRSCPGGGFFFEEFSLCPVGGAMMPTTDPVSAGFGGGFICFPGDSEIQIQDKKEPIMMKDLSLGDKVMVADGRYETVYSFGHKQENVLATYIHIGTSEKGGPSIELSENHMVYLVEGNPTPASLIKLGDIILAGSGESVVVTSIQKVTRRGAYAPFTQSGALVVNGIVASNYVALGNSSYLQISGFEFPVTYQWLAHTFNAPHRLAAKMGFVGESYSDVGISSWVDVPHRVFRFLLSQSPFLAIPIIAPTFFLLALLGVVETIIAKTSMTALAVVVFTTIVLFNKNLKFKTLAIKT